MNNAKCTNTTLGMCDFLSEGMISQITLESVMSSCQNTSVRGRQDNQRSDN